jgi:UDP-N-acetylmuramate-alanine ligase
VTPRGSCLVGEADDAQVRAGDVVLDDGGRAAFTVHTPAGTRAVHLGLVGRHHVGNALAVIAVAPSSGCRSTTSWRPRGSPTGEPLADGGHRAPPTG